LGYNQKRTLMLVEQERVIREWYERYGQRLYRRLCAAARNAEEAQDISQETFLKVALKLREDELGEVIRNPEAFLHRVAFNELYNRRKRQKLHRHLEEIFGETEFEMIHEITPEQGALAREEMNMARKVINDLPDRRRQVFLMTRMAQMNHQEVASALGISKDTVKKHVGRVLTALRRMRADYHETGSKRRMDSNDG